MHTIRLEALHGQIFLGDGYGIYDGLLSLRAVR
jgi:hypothetical protein